MDKSDKEQIIEHFNKVNKETLEKMMEIRKDIQCLIEVQQKLIHERLNVTMPPFPKEYGAEKQVENSNTNFKLNISSFGDTKIKITGKETFNYKDAFKEAGQSKWESDLKFWSLPLASLERLVEKLKSMGLVENKDFCVNVQRTAVSNKPVPSESTGHSFIDDN